MSNPAIPNSHDRSRLRFLKEFMPIGFWFNEPKRYINRTGRPVSSVLCPQRCQPNLRPRRVGYSFGCTKFMS